MVNRRNLVQRWRTHSGFSLVELMVTVAIIGILMSISVPAYRDYLIRSNRAAAKAYLLEMVSKQEQYVLQNRKYATQAEIVAVLPLPSEVDNHYSLAVVSIEPDATAVPPVLFHSFSATLTPDKPTIQLDDGVLRITSLGLRTWKGTERW